MTVYDIALKKAADPNGSSNLSGVYILKLNGVIMKVGSAAIGVQKRMQQYYGLNEYCGMNHYINSTNRDRITVTYQTCNASDCRELESKLFDKYSCYSMPWAFRRPRCNKDTCTLYI